MFGWFKSQNYQEERKPPFNGRFFHNPQDAISQAKRHLLAFEQNPYMKFTIEIGYEAGMWYCGVKEE